ncbi:MAG: sulfite exporter TauE/SafE family protein [Planctomycetes bacterium]|nr:sulfite exporter TauE/SafE family protein [Planctomycetota bacterium]
MTPWTDSFIFGAANSVHCACMCGPLALAFQGGAKGAVSYHFGRTLSYGAIGVVLGGLGSVLGSRELGTPTAWVAFVLAAGLVVLALLGERGAVAIPGLGRALQSTLAKTRAWPATARAGALGLFTPLLPCGLLWAACASATIAGSALDGGAVMVGFALGSLPLLFLAQTQVVRLAQRFGPRTLRYVQQAAMLLAAGMLVWRGVVAMQGQSCCH